jgi:hypothetical protein
MCTELTPTLAVRLHSQFMETGLCEIHNLNSSKHNVLACSHPTGLFQVECCPGKHSHIIVTYSLSLFITM